LDRDDGASSLAGFTVLDIKTGEESSQPVGGETADVQSGRWTPLGDPLGSGFLASRYLSNGRREIVRIGEEVVPAGSSAVDAVPLLDVTNAESFDYRWLQTVDGLAEPFMEVAPLAVGRSDIYEVKTGADGARTSLTLLDSSFGWNASLPAFGSFTDLAAGEPFFEAAALLRAEGVVGGFSDGSFRPDDAVKRAQFAKMLTGALGLDVYRGIPRPPFRDIDADVAGHSGEEAHDGFDQG
jgi:hypothetical protein